MRKLTAYAHFNNDPSVGMFPHGHTIELPFDKFENEEDRETCRKLIKEVYTQLDNESVCSWVVFSDEPDND
jgi:hypothetical protein